MIIKNSLLQLWNNCHKKISPVACPNKFRCKNFMIFFHTACCPINCWNTLVLALSFCQSEMSTMRGVQVRISMSFESSLKKKDIFRWSNLGVPRFFKSRIHCQYLNTRQTRFSSKCLRLESIPLRPIFVKDNMQGETLYKNYWPGSIIFVCE